MHMYFYTLAYVPLRNNTFVEGGTFKYDNSRCPPPPPKNSGHPYTGLHLKLILRLSPSEEVWE